MTGPPVTAEEWKERNSHRLIECRWNSVITPEACRAYQSGNARYVIHFNGSGAAHTCANAEFLLCLGPEPCPHLLSDPEAEELRAERNARGSEISAAKRRLVDREKTRRRLTDPDLMLEEPDRARSLLGR
jgi:hypothetical protein